MAGQAAAATATPPAEEPAAVENVVVTASRIVRDGFSAPTPTTVIGVEQFQKSPAVHVADYVNQLPQMHASQSPQRTRNNLSSGIGGANILNLRGLGMERTLTMLDGRRVVGAAPTGVVDVNLFPSMLVSRVEVVTGGASAAWGSDAVGGVVNFILDTKFEGFKGSIEGGATTYKDGNNLQMQLAAGRSFAGGRGHIVIAGMASTLDEIAKYGRRDWYTASKFFVNPAWVRGNNQPYFLIAPNVYASGSTEFGLITSVTGGAPASLVGTMFNRDGTTSRYDFGTPVAGGSLQIGGTPSTQPFDTLIQPGDRQRQIFGHVTYDFSDSVTGFLEASYTTSEASWRSTPQGQSAATAATIRQDNPYLPAAIRAQMPVGSTLRIGRDNLDFMDTRAISERSTRRFVTGLDAKLGGDWKFSSYLQYGKTSVDNNVFNNAIPTRIVLAEDAVTVSAANVGTSGLAIGSIACRSTLTDPRNGCIPINIFSAGSVAEAARNYISAKGLQTIRMRQIVGSAQVSGTAFSNWAGPVSLVLGVEGRKDKLFGDADDFSKANLFRLGNFPTIQGRQSVAEGFAEAVVPLLSKLPFAQMVDLNLAGRYTHYSVSGSVKTWKVGLNWVVNDDLRLRGTRSRDIRAPNLQDLFATRIARQSTIFDPANNVNISVVTTTSGNLGLTPEIADTLGLGAVYRPSWLKGFSASVDYFDISIKNAIATVPPVNIVRFCFEGNASYCPSVTRTSAGVLSGVASQPFNANSETLRGLDFEVSYRPNLERFMPGQLNFRALATRTLERKIDALGTIDNLLNETAETSAPGPVKWRGLVSADYTLGPSTTAFTVRYIGPGIVDNNYIEGSNQEFFSISDNTIDSMTTLDVSETLSLKQWTGRNIELFGVVKNITAAKPPVSVFSGTTSTAPGINWSVYDLVGRSFLVGVRFSF